MDCKMIRDLVSESWEGEPSPEAREHVSNCVACQGFLRDARLVRAGFRALAEEPVPAASLGFASRLTRRLQEWEAKGARSDFFEAVGRRFVYATLALTLALLLSLVLPTSGPVRGVAGTEFLGLQTVSQSSQPDVVGGGAVDPRDWNLGRLPD
jgi:hypothetical protein